MIFLPWVRGVVGSSQVQIRQKVTRFLFKKTSPLSRHLFSRVKTHSLSPSSIHLIVNPKIIQNIRWQPIGLESSFTHPMSSTSTNRHPVTQSFKSTKPNKMVVKCDFCYRENVVYISSNRMSFCDDECRSWFIEDQQKKIHDEYLSLQGLWPHRG